MPAMAQRSPVTTRAVQHVFVFLTAAVLAGALYGALHRWADPNGLLFRYLAGHPVEYAEVLLFVWAMTALMVKAVQVVVQRLALRRGLLPEWNGQPLPLDQAASLLDRVERMPRWLRTSLLGQRIHAALEFVVVRDSTDGLDAFLRRRSDADAEAVEGGYALVRFITWAIPILGFLGTVLGITEAIANVTPEQLAGSISGVTAGLAVAFDTTALALILSMVVMFTTFLVDRGEQGVLQAVDAYAEQELIHRFERRDPVVGEGVRLIRQGMGEVLHGMERLVQRQAEIWAETFRVLQARAEQEQRQASDRLAQALSKALEQTLSVHEQRLSQTQQAWQNHLIAGLAPVERLAAAVEQTRLAIHEQAQRIGDQAALLKPLLDAEQHILRLQETMSHNLQLLGQSGAFLEAVHSLTAAIHLLTARTEGGAPRAATWTPRKQQGNAA